MVNMPREVLEVPLEDCEPDPRFMYRVRYNLEDLVGSIAERGQLYPAFAWRRGDGKYMVFAGIRRLMAARAAREKHGRPRTFLLYTVPPDTPVEEMWRIAYEENASQQTLTNLDLAKLAASLRDVMPLTKLNITENQYAHLSRISRNITEEELEDLRTVEDLYNSASPVERHLALHQIAGLVGLDRYTRMVAAWYALELRFDPGDERDMAIIRRIVRNRPIPTPLLKYFKYHDMEPPREPAPPAEHVKRADVVGEQAPVGAREATPAQEATPPAPTGDLRGAEEVEPPGRATPPEAPPAPPEHPHGEPAEEPAPPPVEGPGSPGRGTHEEAPRPAEEVEEKAAGWPGSPGPGWETRPAEEGEAEAAYTVILSRDDLANQVITVKLPDHPGVIRIRLPCRCTCAE